ncbi:MAG: DUF748 domain-containing protein, partial [Myxococcales bacterium]|nr:DUF748 domain-containing protein [Myxococcales bacterium]
GAPAELAVAGTLAGGTLVGGGTTRADVWPPPTHLALALQDLDVVAVSGAFGDFTGARATAGTASVAASVDIREDGEVRPDAHGRIDGLAAVWDGWSGSAEHVETDVFAGSALATRVTMRGAEGSPLERASATSLRARWDMDGYLTNGELRATLDVEQPVVDAVRPEPSAVERPTSRSLDLDVHAHDGRLTWRDTGVTPEVRVELDPFELSIEHLGTAAQRAHWTLDAQARRGGHLVGTADVDAFAGPGRTQDPRVHASLLGMSLGAWGDAARAYLGVDGLTGRGDGELHLDAEGTRLDVHTEELGIRTSRLDVVAGLGDLRVEWRTDGDAPVITGSADDVRVLVAPGGEGSPGPLPRLRIPSLDVHGLQIAMPTHAGILRLADGMARARSV